MKTKHKKYNVILISFLVCCFFFCVGTEAVGVESVEMTIFNSINEDRGELNFNAVLAAVAEKRSQVVFEKEFEGRVPGEKEEASSMLAEAGYGAEKSGELTAMVVFSNYMAPGRAAEIMFDSIKDQAQKQSEAESLFAADFRDAGIFVKESVVKFSNQSYNAYLAVVEYAVPEPFTVPQEAVDVMEQKLLNLINQARSLPEKALPEAGIVRRLAPLTPGLLDEAGPFNKVYSCDLETFDPDVAVQSIYQQMKEECKESSGGDCTVLQSGEIHGVDITMTITCEGNQYPRMIRTRASLKLGTVESDQAWISGFAYSDLNKNGLYDAGEEEAGLPVIVSDIGIHTRTGIAGEILESVEEGLVYRVFMFDKTGRLYYQDTEMPDPGFLCFEFKY